MTRVRLKGFKFWTQRYRRQDGNKWEKKRCQHRASGKYIDIEAFPVGTAGFFAACQRIEQGYKPQAPVKSRKGTLGEIFDVWQETDRFRDLSVRTKKEYRDAIKFFEPVADTPADKITTRICAKIHDRAA